MRVVITGYNGQLGRQLAQAFAAHDTLPLDLPCDDITDRGVIDCIGAYAPDLIVHAAAYSDVDGAEKDPDLAYKVNALGTQNVALAAQRVLARAWAALNRWSAEPSCRQVASDGRVSRRRALRPSA